MPSHFQQAYICVHACVFVQHLNRECLHIVYIAYRVSAHCCVRVPAYCCYQRALSCFLSVSHTRTYHVVEQGMLGFVGSMAPVPVTNPMYLSASAMPMSPQAVVNPIYSSGSAMPRS